MQTFTLTVPLMTRSPIAPIDRRSPCGGRKSTCSMGTACRPADLLIQSTERRGDRNSGLCVAGVGKTRRGLSFSLQRPKETREMHPLDSIR
jgi:hypothetical protein